MPSDIINIVNQLQTINDRLVQKEIENASIRREEESWKRKIAQIDAEIARQNELISEREEGIKAKKQQLSDLQNAEKV